MFERLSITMTMSHETAEGLRGLWTVSWTGTPPEAGDIRDFRAPASSISADRYLGPAERTYGKKKIYGSIP
jgi:hypothetical protein